MGFVITVLMVIFVIAFLMRLQERDQALFEMVSLTPKAVETEVGGQGTPDYNRLIEEQNELEAKEAEALGHSYVPTPVGRNQEPVTETSVVPLAPLEKAVSPQETPGKTPLILAPPAVAQPAPPAPKPVPKAVPPPTPTPFPANLKKAILDELKNVIAGSNNPLTPPVVKTSEATSTPNPLTKDSFPESKPPLKPGELLAATATLAINSDVPSPAMATVTFGPFKGAKLLGSFTKGETGAVLTFNRLIPLKGPTLNIEALAIDPRTNQAAIASKVEDHFFQRWGGLLASGFLEGFGAALGNRGGRVYATGDILIEDRPGKTVADASLEALGQVGQKSGEVFRKNFDRPPTIHINAGESLGILIISVQGFTP
jgi:hypothetical protein